MLYIYMHLQVLYLEFLFYILSFFLCCQSYSGDEELCCVYVPTNHIYLGDVFLINSKDVIRPNLSVREGIGKLPLRSLDDVFMEPCQCGA